MYQQRYNIYYTNYNNNNDIQKRIKSILQKNNLRRNTNRKRNLMENIPKQLILAKINIAGGEKMRKKAKIKEKEQLKPFRNALKIKLTENRREQLLSIAISGRLKHLLKGTCIKETNTETIYCFGSFERHLIKSLVRRVFRGEWYKILYNKELLTTGKATFIFEGSYKEYAELLKEIQQAIKDVISYYLTKINAEVSISINTPEPNKYEVTIN